MKSVFRLSAGLPGCLLGSAISQIEAGLAPTSSFVTFEAAQMLNGLDQVPQLLKPIPEEDA